MSKDSASLLLKSGNYSKGGKTIITCENKSKFFNAILWSLWKYKEEVMGVQLHLCCSKWDIILVTCGLTESV